MQSLQKSKANWEAPYQCLCFLAAKSPCGCIFLWINSPISSNGCPLLPALQNFSLCFYPAKMSGILLFRNFRGAKSVLEQDLQVQSWQKCSPSNAAAAVLFWCSNSPCLENWSTAVPQLNHRGSPNQGMNVNTCCSVLYRLKKQVKSNSREQNIICVTTTISKMKAWISQ